MKYGIIGSGMMGQEHIRNIALLPGARTTALADSHTPMLNAARALAPEAQTFLNFREMIAADPCDAYVVATPNFHHHEVMQDLIPLGKPILCEKPLCTTVEDCKDLISLAQMHHTPVWVAMEYRYMPAVARLIEEARKGTAGATHMLAIREHRFPFLEKVDDWNRFADKTGGTLVEKCCHFFDLMRLIIGSEARRVFATGGKDVNFIDEIYDGLSPDILDNAFVLVDFENGTRAMLDLCMFAEGSRWQESITLTGADGQIEAFVPGPSRFAPPDRPDHSLLRVSPRAGGQYDEEIGLPETLKHAGDHNGSTFYQHEGFHAFAKNGGVPEVSLTDGLRAVQIGWAAEHSIKTGEVVSL